MPYLRAYERGFMNIVIYTQAACPYCDLAKKEMDSRGWEYTVYSINEGSLAKNNRASLFERLPDVKTVPQIWINDNHIGGYDDLKTWLSEYLDSKYI